MPRGIANKEAAILGAAVRLFSRRHYYSVTVPEIAREAAVGEGTIYIYFKNKEDLAAAAFNSIQADLEREVISFLPDQADSREQLNIVAAALFARAADDPDAIGYGLLIRHRDFLPVDRIQEGDHLTPLLRMLMVRGRRSQAIRAAPIDVLCALWLGIVRAGLELHAGGTTLDPDQVGAMAWDAVAEPVDGAAGSWTVAASGARAE